MQFGFPTFLIQRMLCNASRKAFQIKGHISGNIYQSCPTDYSDCMTLVVEADLTEWAF